MRYNNDMVSDVYSTDNDTNQQKIYVVPFGYFIPFFWLFVFCCLWKSQERTFRELERTRARQTRDEPLVVLATRPETP